MVLASDTVWSVTEDDFGRMYFGTGRGLLIDLTCTTRRVRHFTVADGLAAGLINHCIKDRYGNIWSATGMPVCRDSILARNPSMTAHHRSISAEVQIAGEDAVDRRQAQTQATGCRADCLTQ